MALNKKPPVVTIIGHVDHGKTSLLDYIRKTKNADKEYGQITQAIGAYQIELKGEKVTFIDTPGHEAFSKMRVCGAKVADIVILVVSVDDGVMPQTKECIRLILENKIPVVVAVTKIDLPQSSIDKVKTQLAENGIFVEGYGGSIPVIPLSSKTGEGVDQLLEMILLMSEMEELKADPQGELQALVIESKADKFCGCVATLIIQSGTLKEGDKICGEGVFSKVKLIKDDKGKSIKEAFPGQPVLVLGFLKLPKVGSLITASDAAGQGEKSIRCDEFGNGSSTGKPVEDKINIILKADVFGSLEAILGCISDEFNVISAVGDIMETDVLTAKNLKAEIYVFNLPISKTIEKLSQTEKVKIYTFKVIYDLLKKLQERIVSKGPEKKILGKAEILAVFEMKGEKIAGGKVTEGKLNKKYNVDILRDGVIFSEKKIISSLKQQKQDVNEINQGEEFGVVFSGNSGNVDFKPGDVLISYSLE